MILSRRVLTITLVVALFCQKEIGAQATQVQYLSGTGKDSTVAWQFYLNSGRGSGTWTTIPVPSNWECKGFGGFYYQSDPTTAENAIYRYTFRVPSSWSQLAVSIGFDGVMTDAQVLINGQSAGPIHQGGFYRFKYDITNLLNFTDTNRLEVDVARASADQSVNDAERHGDYWNFSGIYRPVYLEASPKEHIDRMAINAKADGSIAVDVYPVNLVTATSVSVQVQSLGGAAVGSAFTATVATGQAVAHLTATQANPALWTAETPNLYQIKVTLLSGAVELHTLTQKFGFRTIEVRAGSGIYLNNQAIKIRGVCRHCFWPTEGRTLNRAISLGDALLMRDMNMNAVRMSHYPPDDHFLDICDSLGLYIEDELAGWQHAYNTTVGKKLITEMIYRDVNHPCIILWGNGNEGGWNTALDSVFGNRDPQKRTVMHPGNNTTFSNILDDHYDSYASMQTNVNGGTIYLPTEYLHGLYDGGLGSGLYDYWNLMGTKSICAGGFLWAFLDEGVVRTDQNGTIDTRGNLAPDGLVGPYRQKEGSYYTVKEIWSPAYIDMDTLPASFSGVIPIENRFDFTNLNSCSFSWKLVDFNFATGDTGMIVRKTGTATAPSVLPHAKSQLTLGLPTDWKNYQALVLTANDPFNRELYTWSWMIKSASDIRKSIVDTLGGQAAAFTQTATSITVTAAAGTLQYVFSKTSARLTSLQKNGHTISLSNGPTASWDTTAGVSLISVSQQGNAVVVSAQLSRGPSAIIWTVYGNGWCKLAYNYALNGNYDYYGVNFTYPETKATALEWVGRGPYHAWKNRMKGGAFNFWRTAYNDGVAGENWIFPEFKGYFADVAWARLITAEDTLNFVFDNQNVFFRNFTAKEGTTPVNAIAAFPAWNISFLQAIAPMGSKFAVANQAGPQGQQNAVNGSFAETIYMYFGNWTPASTGTKPLSGNNSKSGTRGSLFKMAAGEKYMFASGMKNACKEIFVYTLNGQIVKKIVTRNDEFTLKSRPGIYLVRIFLFD